MPRRTLLALAALPAAAALLAPTTAPAQLPYSEDFTGPDGAAWPAPWAAVTPHVTVQDLNAGRGRLNGTLANVGRMILPGFSETDVEVEVTVTFENVGGQGFGFYVRQNGGYLQDTTPFGQGYAVFLKGGWGWPEDLGIWHELNGVEIQFATAYNPVPGGLQDDVPYRIRYRVTQDTPDSTRIQARVWPAAQAEPALWNVDVLGGAPVLQGTAGGFAADIYNALGNGHIYVDDLVINQYPVPTEALALPGAAERFRAPVPNPARDATVLRLELGRAVDATLRVYDVRGRLRATVLDGRLGPGPTELHWNLADGSGRPLPSGVYFLRLDAAGVSSAQRVVVRR